METMINLKDEDKKLYELEVTPIEARATALAINSNEENVTAIEGIKFIKKKKAMFHDKFNPVVKKAHEAHKEAKSVYNFFINPFINAENTIARKVKDWEFKEHKRIEKVNADAEADRLQKEREAKEKMDAKAEKELDKGHVEKADNILEQSENHTEMPPVRPPEPSKPKGTSSRLVWKAQIVDAKLICKAVGDGVIPITAVTVNQGELDRYAKMFKGTNPVPGIRFYEDVALSVRK